MTVFPKDHDQIVRALQYPRGVVDVVIDTDAYNEVDDQFAVAWALASPQRMNVQAVYAAPFCSKAIQKMMPIPDEMLQQSPHYAGDPAEGMEKSYQELLKLFALMDQPASGRVFRGSTRYLGGDGQPVESEAARDLVQRAMARGEGERLYVLAIGAITNIASAILMEPKIVDKITVVWLSGQPLHFQNTAEFNLMQDMIASKLMLDCGVPLILIPCMGVASHLTLTAPELDQLLIGKSKIGSYLGEIVRETFTPTSIPMSDRFMKMAYLKGVDDVPAQVSAAYTAQVTAWSHVVWDISTVGYLMNPNWSASTLVPAPILTDDLTWQLDPKRHPIRLCHYINRDYMFGDMFAKFSASEA
jgi:inosine-uridine nucleoside N-ribohydrolase